MIQTLIKPFKRALVLAAIALLSALHVPSSITHGQNQADSFVDRAANFHVKQEASQLALSLPVGKGSWLIEVSRSGGKRPGKESVRINSAGEIVVISEHFKNGQREVDCSLKEKLSHAELLKLKGAILSAKPSVWQDRYSDPKHPICCDQPTIELALQKLEARGKARTYSTSWYPGSSKLRPADLDDVATLVQTIWNDVRDRCEK